MQKRKSSKSSLQTKINNFHKRWNIELNENAKWMDFRNRFMNSYVKILAQRIYMDGDVKTEFFEIAGVHKGKQKDEMHLPSLFESSCDVYSTLRRENNTEKLIFYLQILFWIKSLDKTYKEKFFNSIQEDISISQVPIQIKHNTKDFLLYPAGAKILDEKLVNDNLDWLEDYPKAYTTFTNALKTFDDKTKLRDVVDNLRLSLELFLKEFLGNNKSLENQQSEIGSFLKSKTTSPELRNLYWTLIDGYSKYQNANAKHNSSVKEHEVEFILYLTGSFIRFLITQK